MGKVWALGFRVQGLGFKVWGLGLGFRLGILVEFTVSMRGKYHLASALT